MYIPNHFKMKNTADCQHFIQEFGFGVIVSSDLTGTHLPFYIEKNEGELGTLYAHCARANPHWKSLQNAEALVVFSGPHSYISPNWYAKQPAVPTWNYTAVHAYGKVTLLGEQESLCTVNKLMKKYEPELLNDIANEHYKQKLLAGIVAFKIDITQLQGKLKLGQQKKKEDQHGVYQALEGSDNLNDKALANYMQKINVGLGFNN